MKNIHLIAAFIIGIVFYIVAFGQTNCQKYDLSKIWLADSLLLGYIGENYQRLRIVFIDIKKDTQEPCLYHAQGKTLVGLILRNFQGTLTIKDIHMEKGISSGSNTPLIDSIVRFHFRGDYQLDGNRKEDKTGQFSGVFDLACYYDKNDSLRYDELEDYSDSYRNNQFTGEWRSYSTKDRMKCNWGDRRIPDSQGLDIGIGEFYPREEFAKFGWQEYINAFEQRDTAAMRLEWRKWW
jgi:hypothetical protein